MDLNEPSLRHTARRIARYHPETVVGDALMPLPFEDNRFGSIGMNMLLHCMPGDLSEKSVVFDQAARCLTPGGVVFSATVLNIQDKMNWLAKRVFSDFNKKGIFCNREDSLETLESELTRCFDDVHITMKGVAALFSGKKRVNPQKKR
jgi:ubiquinone/menaquinone biosynthesis C-methylase UbiE